MTRVHKICLVCGYRAKRDLMDEVGCRGVHETSAEPARCPNGHGDLVREDGVSEAWASWMRSKK